jgi:hypothetical protein
MIIYHGTSIMNAKSILAHQFTRSTDTSYTGTGICFSESMSISYEYGAYEHNGCILACELTQDSLITDIGLNCVTDQYFIDHPQIDGITSYGGNVVVIWNPHVIFNIKKLTKFEAFKQLCQEFKDDGDNVAYNYPVQDHCDAYWQKINTI